jgi:hypothetical protein
MERGIDLTAMMAQGITMGDEFHQRNIATSALLMRTLAPHLARLNTTKSRWRGDGFPQHHRSVLPQPGDGLL